MSASFDILSICGDFRYMAHLPELILFGIVFEPDRFQFSDQYVLADIHIFTEFVERCIAIAKFHVDDAKQHHRIFRKFQNYSFFKTAAKIR